MTVFIKIAKKRKFSLHPFHPYGAKMAEFQWKLPTVIIWLM
jgi:hypothetical protein